MLRIAIAGGVAVPYLSYQPPPPVARRSRTAWWRTPLRSRRPLGGC